MKIKVTPKPCPTCGDDMDGARVYRKTATIIAKQMNRVFVVQTPHGLVKGQVGDYLCSSMEGTDRWPVKKEIFERTHVEVNAKETVS